MKGTEHFKRTIQMYLEQRAAEDTLFARNYRNPAKNIDDCVTYILNYVQRSGCNGFTDGEIFGQAVHYYDENEIEVGKRVKNRFRFLEAHDMTIEAVVTKSMWLLAQNCDSFDQLQQRFYRQVNFDTFYH